MSTTLLDLVLELNTAVQDIVAKYSSELVDEYYKAGGAQLPDDAQQVFKDEKHFQALLGLLHSARAQARARDLEAKTGKVPEAVQRDANWLATGAVKAVKALTLPETDESKARLAICESCDQWTGKSCKICGCFVKLKVKIPEEKCPAGKW